MTAPSLRHAVCALAALCVVAVGAGACRDDEGSEPAAGTSEPATTEVAPSSTFADQPPEACSVATLQTASAPRFPGVTVLDESCYLDAALATLEGSSVPGGSGVGMYFAAPDGEWLLAMTFTDRAALEQGAPPQLPRALIQSWAARRDRRLNPSPPAAERTTTTDTTEPPVSAPQGE